MTSDDTDFSSPTDDASDANNDDEDGKYAHQDRPDHQPPFHLGDNERPGGTPTPPGGETVDTETATEPKSKRVMLRAERHDEIEITLVVGGMTKIPQTFTVVKRTETYYGPRLVLVPEDIEGDNWMLTCPGPNTQLILWKYITGTEDTWRSGLVPTSEVKAKISDTEQYNLCNVCGEPLRDIWHERLSAAGVCEKMGYGDETE